MTRLLALDTSAGTSGAALLSDGEVISACRKPGSSRHAQTLFEMVEQTLAEAGVAKEQLDGVAVTHGPGAFTGLRVGVATAKGIGFALGVKMVGVSSLEALARSAMPFDGTVAAVFDAKKGQVYGAAYDGQSGAERVEEGAWDPETFAARVAELGRGALFTGSGVGAFGDLFSRIVGEGYAAAPEASWSIDPAAVALLGWEAWRRDEAVAPAELAPVYHRLSEAEENKRKGAFAKGLRI